MSPLVMVLYPCGGSSLPPRPPKSACAVVAEERDCAVVAEERACAVVAEERAYAVVARRLEG
jgi:hypothetical protein